MSPVESHHPEGADIDDPRLARWLGRLLNAALTCQSLNELIQGVLAQLIECVDVGVIRMREGDRLRSRAAIGLEEEVEAGFSLPVDQGFPVTTLAVEAGDVCWSDVIRKKGVSRLYRLPLMSGDELLGLVYLGALEDREISREERRLFEVFAAKAGAAIARQLEREALQRAVHSRDEALAVVAHDLRNPVNVIAIAAHALARRVHDPLARRSLDAIIHAAERSDLLIRDLLDIAAIEGNRFSIAKQPTEMADVILASLESQASLAASASIILGTDLSPDLPAIEGDRDRLLQVLENLLGNALKFTAAGGGVTVGASEREGDLMVWVKDTGTGVRADLLPYLFDRFWQAQKADRRGAGLGLAICKGIVEAHGGRIWAQSGVNAGTTVFFTIPASVRPPGIAVAEVADILLVDDKPDNLLSLRAILDRPHYRLVSAASGEEALRLPLRSSFSLALIDIAMPGMNGLEVAVHLKELERSSDIPIIFITAFGDDPEEIHRAYSAGGADYLVKPLDPEIVRKKVAVFVDLSRRRRGTKPLRAG